MRISTSQIFDAGARGIGQNQSDLFKLQNQLSTGRRMLTPQDDPIAAGQALVLTQAKSVSTQFLKNQDDAKSKLGALDTQLSSVNDLLQSVRERLVQAGSTTLTDSDRTSIAKDLEGGFSQLLGIANSQDASGGYTFSGYKGNITPFSTTATGVSYQGDNGRRLSQVEASRQMATNVTGSELFETIRSGNGNFATAPASTAGGGPVNTGTGVIDQGAVTDQSKWSSSLSSYSGVQIKFTVVAGVTNYQLFDSTGATAYTNPQTYTPGQSIKLEDALAATPVDFGATVTINGQPGSGDAFTVTPSTNQSIFTTLRTAINTLTTGISGAYTATEFSNRIASSLQNLDQSLTNVNDVRATLGANLKELDSLTNSGKDMQLQYASSLSALQDLDYNKAITDISKTQMQLQAAQLSFKQTSQLSLFSIL